MTKVDLDELERHAKATLEEAARYFGDISQVDWFVGPLGGDFDAATEYANRLAPSVTLALIARIRELEDLAGDLLSDHVRWPDRDRMPGSAQYALLEKGVVLM